MEYLDPFLMIAKHGLFAKIVFGIGAVSKAAYAAGLEPPRATYLTGGFGCAVPLGIGLAIGGRNSHHIAVVEGDGGLLHSPNSLVTAAFCKNCRLDIIVLENKVYASTGGQPIPSLQGGLDLTRIALAVGIDHVRRCKDAAEFRDYLDSGSSLGVRFVVVEVDPALPSLPSIPDSLVRSSLIPNSDLD